VLGAQLGPSSFWKETEKTKPRWGPPSQDEGGVGTRVSTGWTPANGHKAPRRSRDGGPAMRGKHELSEHGIVDADNYRMGKGPG